MLYPAELQALPQPRTITLAQREICCLARISHEPFCCNRGLAAATSWRAAQRTASSRARPSWPQRTVSSTFGPLRLYTPVSLGDFAISQRIVMNNVRQAVPVLHRAPASGKNA